MTKILKVAESNHGNHAYCDFISKIQFTNNYLILKHPLLLSCILICPKEVTLSGIYKQYKNY